jgi:ATP-dependent Lon protease
MLYGNLSLPDTLYVLPDAPTPEGGLGSEVNLPRPSTPAGHLESLSSIQEERLEVATVRVGSFAASKAARQVGHHLLESAQQVAGAIGGSLAAGSVSRLLTGQQSGLDNGVSQAMATSLSSAATTALMNTVKTVSSSRLDEKDAKYETYRNLVDLSKEALLRRPEAVQNAVRNLDSEVKDAYSNQTKDDAWFAQKLRHRSEILLSLPYYSKSVPGWRRGSPERYSLEKKIKTLVDSYPPENRIPLQTLIHRICSVAESTEASRRPQAFLYGPAGTGKTWLVTRLSETLGLPMIKIRVGEKNIDDLLGLKFGGFEPPTNMSDQELIGELPRQMIKSGFNNPIVFIDELSVGNPYLASQLKLLLDANNKGLEIKAYNVSVDWSRATVICASNDKLSDPALASRMELLTFDSVSRDTKITVAKKTIDLAVASQNVSLAPTQVKALLERSLKHINYLVDKDSELSPGAKNLEIAAESLVDFLSRGVMSSKPRRDVEISKFLDMKCHSLARSLTQHPS